MPARSRSVFAGLYSVAVIKTRAHISAFPCTALKSAFLAVKDPALQNWGVNVRPFLSLGVNSPLDIPPRAFFPRVGLLKSGRNRWEKEKLIAIKV